VLLLQLHGSELEASRKAAVEYTMQQAAVSCGHSSWTGLAEQHAELLFDQLAGLPNT
jgi:hypothetical protein